MYRKGRLAFQNKQVTLMDPIRFAELFDTLKRENFQEQCQRLLQSTSSQDHKRAANMRSQLTCDPCLGPLR